MRRRDFITVLSGTVVSLPLAARAQQKRLPVLGYLGGRSHAAEKAMLKPFWQGMNESGYFENQNVATEYRWANGQHSLFSPLARQLVEQRVSAIVTTGGGDVAHAAKEATSTIPIVFVTGDDPVQSGLVASFNRPGGNLTGIANFIAELAEKQLSLLRDVLPRPAVIAILVTPQEGSAATQIKDATAAADRLAQPIKIFNASTPDEIKASFEAAEREHIKGLLVGGGPLFVTNRKLLIALAAQYALPAIYFRREYVEDGGLMSYGSKISEGYHQLGIYAAKVLAGTKPADLPVVHPTSIEFVINLRTARTLGLQLPPTLLATADEVIE